MADYSRDDYTPPPRTVPIEPLEKREYMRRVTTHDKFKVDEGVEIQYGFDYDDTNQTRPLKIDPPDTHLSPYREIRVVRSERDVESMFKHIKDWLEMRHHGTRKPKMYRRVVTYGPWIEIEEL